MIQVTESFCDSLVRQIGLVLLQEPTACLGVVALIDGILEEGLFEAIKRDDDAVYLSERVVEVALGAGGGQFGFLVEVDGRIEGRARDVGRRRIGQLPRSVHASRCYCRRRTTSCAVTVLVMRKLRRRACAQAQAARGEEPLRRSSFPWADRG